MGFARLIAIKHIQYQSQQHRLLLLLIAVAALFNVQSTRAETVYITDNIYIGLHEDKSIDSAILKVLPSNTPLEIIKRDNDFVNVKDAEGSTGWISNKYLTNNAPDSSSQDQSAAQARVVELETQIENLKLQQGNPANGDPASAEALSKLAKENEKLKQQINSDKLKSGELQAKLAEMKSQMSKQGMMPANGETKKLRQENDELKEKISSLQGDASASTSGESDSIMSHPAVISLIVFIIGLVAGMFIMDWRSRRRYGGLRT